MNFFNSQSYHPPLFQPYQPTTTFSLSSPNVALYPSFLDSHLSNYEPANNLFSLPQHAPSQTYENNLKAASLMQNCLVANGLTEDSDAVNAAAAAAAYNAVSASFAGKLASKENFSFQKSFFQFYF
jgi:hypothetical protein